MLKLVDTHNHLFVGEFTSSQERLKQTVNPAVDAGLYQMLICAGDLSSSRKTHEVASLINAGFAVGIHPLAVNEKLSHTESEEISALVQSGSFGKNLAAIGEIGLDGTITDTIPMPLQEEIFVSFLKLARNNDLPVSVHVRGAIDLVAKHLRRVQVCGGVIHAFNGSFEQAKVFLKMGFKLGYGGAFTYSGSKRIRKMLSQLDKADFVLETDCPDMPSSKSREENPESPISVPADIADYAEQAAALRGCTLEEISADTTKNAFTAFPRLHDLGSLKKL